MDDGWYDEAAGPLVRPYAIVGGRTPADGLRLDLFTQILALPSEQEPTDLGPEHLTVVGLCRRPVSIAEIAARVKVPLGVIRVLCADLIDRGLVIMRSPTHRPEQAPDRNLLQAVLDGLAKL